MYGIIIIRKNYSRTRLSFSQYHAARQWYDACFAFVPAAKRCRTYVSDVDRILRVVLQVSAYDAVNQAKSFSGFVTGWTSETHNIDHLRILPTPIASKLLPSAIIGM